jgi:hypothetical protein
MPLTDDQIRQRRNMSREASRDQDIFRIAEALEEIRDELRSINEHLGGHRGPPA